MASHAHAQQPDSVAAPAGEPVEPVLDLPYSPRGAFFRSILLPGWGQAYVGAPGRGAVYFGLTAGTLAMTYVARRELRDAQADFEWREALQDEPPPDEELLRARERKFEDWAAISVFLMFLSGADAYVSAYLADFDERIGVRPGAGGSLDLRVDVPVGGRP